MQLIVRAFVHFRVITNVEFNIALNTVRNTMFLSTMRASPTDAGRIELHASH